MVRRAAEVRRRLHAIDPEGQGLLGLVLALFVIAVLYADVRVRAHGGRPVQEPCEVTEAGRLAGDRVSDLRAPPCADEERLPFLDVPLVQPALDEAGNRVAVPGIDEVLERLEVREGLLEVHDVVRRGGRLPRGRDPPLQVWKVPGLPVRHLPGRRDRIHEVMEARVCEEIVQDEGVLDPARDVLDRLVRVLSKVPPDDPVVLLLERLHPALPHVHPEPLRVRTERDIVRHRLRALFQHRGEGPGVFRRRNGEGLECLRGEVELPRARDRFMRPEGPHPRRVA